MDEVSRKRSIIALIMCLLLLVSVLTAGCTEESDDDTGDDDTGDDDTGDDDTGDDDTGDDDTGDDGNGTPEETWTFMVYMSDCDLEYFAISDLNEMETVGSNDNLNIVVQLDRWESDSDQDDTSNGDWKTAKRFYVTKDQDPDTINSDEITDLGEINTGDLQELVEFVQWAMQTYPADHYFLDLWDHGDGIEGVCCEQSMEPNDIITIDEMKSALATITDQGTNKLDIVGFDACLMSTIEVANEVAPYADYMIASEVTEPGTGWDYSFLGNLIRDPNLGAVELGKKIVDSFVAQGSVNPEQTFTLALLNLTEKEIVMEELNNLSQSIRDADITELTVLKEARRSAQPVQEGRSSEAVDLYDLADKIKSATSDDTIKGNVDALLAALDSFILYSAKRSGSEDIDVSNAHGLSLYSPEFGETYHQEEEYEDLTFDDEGDWDELLEEYYSETTPEQVIYFVEDSLSYDTDDWDEDGWDDTFYIAFEVESLEDGVLGYFGADIYDDQGYLIDYIEYTFIINTTEVIYVELGDLGFILEEADGGAGYYYMAIYLCLGDEYDPDNFQDYAETDYEWLEVYQGE